MIKNNGFKTKFLCFCAIVISIISSKNLFAQKYDESYGKPLIILTETNPWLEVIGSDEPSFVLYEKGQIIYKDIQNKKMKLYEITLTEETLQKLIQSFSISESFYKLSENISTTDWTDQPTNIFEINLKQSKKVSVYGRLDKNSKDIEKTPKEFLSIYNKIKEYKNKDAKEWLPKKIEIMFWDYDYAPNKRPWIKGFPDLNSPTTIKRKSLYSVYIDKEKFEELRKYYLSLGMKESVEINGKKMAVSYRFPFPNIK